MSNKPRRRQKQNKRTRLLGALKGELSFFESNAHVLIPGARIKKAADLMTKAEYYFSKDEIETTVAILEKHMRNQMVLRDREKKSARRGLARVKDNLKLDNPKYEDKEIKKTILLAARHYALHGDLSYFDNLLSQLPNGTWRNRVIDIQAFVKEIGRSNIKDRFNDLRVELDRVSKIPGYTRVKYRS